MFYLEFVRTSENSDNLFSSANSLNRANKLDFSLIKIFTFMFAIT